MRSRTQVSLLESLLGVNPLCHAPEGGGEVLSPCWAMNGEQHNKAMREAGRAQPQSGQDPGLVFHSFIHSFMHMLNIN